jgi:hypothetical protein
VLKLVASASQDPTSTNKALPARVAWWWRRPRDPRGEADRALPFAGVPGLDRGRDPSSWRAVASTVGAAVGGAAWVSTVGSAVVGIRLNKADLPAESVVALMSTEHRFIIGASYLLAPVLVGVLALLVDETLHPPPRTNPHPRLAAATAMILLGAALGTIFLSAHRTDFLVQCAAMALILLVVIKFTPFRRRARERLVVFAMVLLAAGLIALVAEALRAPAFDEATVSLTDHGRANGYYVTTTDTSVVLIKFTNVDGKKFSCPVIEAVPRAEIERIEVGSSRAKLKPLKDCGDRREDPKTDSGADDSVTP